MKDLKTGFWYKNLKPEHCYTAELGALSGARADYDLPRYLTSYDAIIPLIQKQPKYVKEAVAAPWWTEFNTDISDMVDMLNATPFQLCEALLRATGKWVE